MSKEAMKLALEAFKDLEKHRCLHYPNIVKALEEALTQEQGEPVAEYIGNNPDELDLSKRIGLIHRLKFIPLRSKLYTTPQQRKPLTHEQMAKAFADAGLDPDIQNDELSVARAIEAAHGIKE